DVCVAPDGSVFIADWYDPGVGGHGMGDTTRGRIYRLAPQGNPYKVPQIKLDTVFGGLDALDSPCLAGRRIAFSAIAAMDAEKAMNIVNARLMEASPALKARMFCAITSPLNRSAKDPRRKANGMGYAMMLPRDERLAMWPFLIRFDHDSTGHEFA